jgi:hypothetical protein
MPGGMAPSPAPFPANRGCPVPLQPPLGRLGPPARLRHGPLTFGGNIRTGLLSFAASLVSIAIFLFSVGVEVVSRGGKALPLLGAVVPSCHDGAGHDLSLVGPELMASCFRLACLSSPPDVTLFALPFVL